MPDEHIPPQDLDAEQACLGAMLLGGDAARQVAEDGLRPEHFYRDAHRHIAEAALGLSDAGRAVDIVTVAAELRSADRLAAVGGFDYLDRLVRSTPYSTNARPYAAVVTEKARLRRLLEVSRHIGTAAMDPTARSADVLDLADKLVAEVAQDSRERPARPLSGPELIARWRAETMAISTPVSTGFGKLNAILDGGWYRPQVYVLTSLTKNGKSNLAISMLRGAVREGHRVGFVSLEMPVWEVCSKWLSQETGLPYYVCKRVVRDRESDGQGFGSEADRDVFAEAFERFGRGEHLDLWYSAPGPVYAVRRLIRAMRRNGCKFVVVDLINKITVPEADGIYQEMTAAFAMLDGLAAELEMPILGICQQLQGAQVSIAQTKGSRAIEEGAPVLMTLGKRSDDGDRVTAKLEVPANRDGSIATGKRGIELVGNRRTFEWREAGSGESDEQPVRRHGDDDSYLGDPLAADDDDPFAREEPRRLRTGPARSGE